MGSNPTLPATMKGYVMEYTFVIEVSTRNQLEYVKSVLQSLEVKYEYDTERFAFEITTRDISIIAAIATILNEGR